MRNLSAFKIIGAIGAEHRAKGGALFHIKLSLHNDSAPCFPICKTRGTKTFRPTYIAPQGIMKAGVKSCSLERMAVGRPGLKLHVHK